jgi:DNA polymerase-3 subunit delta'
MIEQLLPWHQEVWKQCMAMRERLPHAILLHGRIGTGKYLFARTLSKALLCLHPQQSGLACEACSSCHWFNEESHPDFRLLSPETETDADVDAEGGKKKSKVKSNIAISQVRELADFVHLSSHKANGCKMILVYPAETLNAASANALLKVLEEPSENVIFILVAHKTHQMLPTILSRCQRIAMPVPDESMAITWLENQGIANAQNKLAYFSNAPVLMAEQSTSDTTFEEIWQSLSLGQHIDATNLAAQLVAINVETGLAALQKWLYDLIAIKSGCELRYHLMHRKALQRLADSVNLNNVFALEKKVAALKNVAFHPLNHTLQIESLLFEYMKLFSSK